MYTGYSNDTSSLLRVSDSLFLVGCGIAPMYENVMWESGISEGDIISVTGRRKTLATCYSTNYSPFMSAAMLAQYKPEKEQGPYELDSRKLIWLDAVVRTNAQVKVGDYVKVKSVIFPFMSIASTIEVIPLIEEIRLDSSTLAKWMQSLPIIKGDLILYHTLEPFYSSTAEPKGSLYKVIKTVPDNIDYGVRLDRNTAIRILRD